MNGYYKVIGHRRAYDSYYEDKVHKNRATFKVKNDMHETVTFNPTQMLDAIDLRSHYKIKQGVLQQNLSHIYHFESAHKVCDQFKRLIDMLRKEETLESTHGLMIAMTENI